jgi:ParB-like chromosome segregation protein Spo0J
MLVDLGGGRFYTQPVVNVPIGLLSTSGSPRVSGEDPKHVETLAATESRLPPIIVHRATMRVIDGVHRLRAAEHHGREEIAVQFFDGAEDDAFVLAVKSNIAHGLPLSLADRKSAAARIVSSHPQWSDRMIAAVTGLASKTVAEIRRPPAGEPAGWRARIGQDGRVRPVDNAEGRILARELMDADPTLSLRQVARVVGISPETVRDVRKRIQRGEHPVPARRRHAKRGTAAVPGDERAEDKPKLGTRIERITAPSSQSRAVVLQRLRADPALRLTETGRSLLRLLYIHTMNAEEWENIAENLPAHCSSVIAHLARDCAQIWQEFADRVERQAKTPA